MIKVFRDVLVIGGREFFFTVFNSSVNNLSTHYYYNSCQIVIRGSFRILKIFNNYDLRSSHTKDFKGRMRVKCCYHKYEPEGQVTW